MAGRSKTQLFNENGSPKVRNKCHIYRTTKGKLIYRPIENTLRTPRKQSILELQRNMQLKLKKQGISITDPKELGILVLGDKNCLTLRQRIQLAEYLK